MNTLFIDTSSDCLFLALSKGHVVFESKTKGIKRHSKIILNEIEELLRNNSLEICDINLILVVIGPGSFTGIRIGVSTANALAKALDIEVIGLTSLEIMMFYESQGGAFIDCKNNNYYFYDKEKNKYGVLNIEDLNLYQKTNKVFFEYKSTNDIFSYVFDNKHSFKSSKSVMPFYIKLSSAKKGQYKI